MNKDIHLDTVSRVKARWVKWAGASVVLYDVTRDLDLKGKFYNVQYDRVCDDADTFLPL